MLLLVTVDRTPERSEGSVANDDAEVMLRPGKMMEAWLIPS